MKDNLTDKIKEILTAYPHTRNSDQDLSLIVYQSMGIQTGTVSYEYVTNLIANGTLPSHETIGRCRRKVAEHNPGLRGDIYDKRQENAEEISPLINTDFNQATLRF